MKKLPLADKELNKENNPGQAEWKVWYETVCLFSLQRLGTIKFPPNENSEQTLAYLCILPPTTLPTPVTENTSLI